MTAELWVSQSEAARRESEAGRPVAQSSISRFIAGNPDLPVRRNVAGQVQAVEYNALAAARRESLGVQDKLLARAEAEGPQTAAGAVVPMAQPGSRKRQLEEERLELDLAERKREVFDRSAVEMALESIGVTVMQGLERRRRALATEMAEVGDIRTAEIAIKASDRLLLDGLVRELTKVAEGLTLPDLSDDAEAA